MEDIYGGLKEGAGSAYAPMIAFKHWKPHNLIGMTDLTMPEIKGIYDLPINATAIERIGGSSSIGRRRRASPAIRSRWSNQRC